MMFKIQEQFLLRNFKRACWILFMVTKEVIVYRAYGALFFGAGDKLESILADIHTDAEILILKMHEAISMNGSALHSLEHLHRTAQAWQASYP